MSERRVAEPEAGSARTTERETTTVTIFGTEYRVSGTADAAYIHEVADYVDRTMRDLHERLNLPSSTRLAILTALHVTHELLRERARRDDVLHRVEEKAEALRLMIESTSNVPPSHAGDG